MCTHCGCEAISVIGRLTDEHVAIANAVGALRRAADRQDLDAARSRAVELASLLEPHTAGEERGLFAELRTDAEFADHIDSLCAEHVTIDAALARVADGDLSGVRALELLLNAHIAREENGVVPAAATALDGPAWERVVQRLAASAVPSGAGRG